MYVLGLSSYAHEASCALIQDGRIRAVAEEERWSREKHTWKFPRNAIAWCLEEAGIAFGDVAAIAFFWIPWLEVKGNLGHVLRYLPASLNLLRAGSGSDDLTFGARVRAMWGVGKDIQRHFGLARAPRVHFVEHHLCHAASAFYPSGFEQAAILTVDGRGEAVSTLMAVGRGHRIEKLREVATPHSLGHLYAAVTHHLGFRPFFDEWKVMGMSAYGADAMCHDFEPLVTTHADGTFRLDLRYFGFHTHGRDAWLSEQFVRRFGPARAAGDPYEQRHFDLAFALQRTVERVGVHLARALHEATRLPDLCLTGGVALNCLMNEAILRETPFERCFIQPIANDAGTSLGSALYWYHQLAGHEARAPFPGVYLGPEFDDQAIERAITARDLSFARCEDIAAATAPHVAAGRIVGWFQGRMEAGPRALGDRSIVCSPADPGMKDRLNARVKKREFFRPFAPSVLEERVADWFDLPKGHLSPYMVLTGRVRPAQRDRIPAVVHADGSARVQTVARSANPRYWALIAEVEKLTGIPVVLNTSFNENEPIVCTPEHAVDCFLRTDFDVLAIGDYLVTRRPGAASP